MGMQIESGIGNGKSVAINSKNRMLTDTVTSTSAHDANHNDGRAYNVLFSQSPTAADDCIFYMKNTSETDLVLEGVTLGFINASAVDAEVYMKMGDSGTRNGGTEVTPVNLNSGSGLLAEVTAEQGADLDGGSATLAGGIEIERWVFANVQDKSSGYLNFNQDIILKKNGTITIWASDAGATYYANMHMSYHNPEAKD